MRSVCRTEFLCLTRLRESNTRTHEDRIREERETCVTPRPEVDSNSEDLASDASALTTDLPGPLKIIITISRLSIQRNLCSRRLEVSKAAHLKHTASDLRRMTNTVVMWLTVGDPLTFTYRHYTVATRIAIVGWIKNCKTTELESTITGI